MTMTTLSVLMPVYNEARTLRTILKRVLDAPVQMDIELVCVDDGSTDGSLEILRDVAAGDPRVKVIAQPRNHGKGRAIRTAIEHMTGDVAIIQDSDLEYDPAEYQKVLQPILDDRADAVYGSRFATSEQRRVLFFWHSLGNKLLTLLANVANDLNLTDMETCYKAVRADLLRSLRITSDRFGFEPEITARLAQVGARIYEVPISYHGRTYEEGKNIGWRDGLEALWLIIKFRFFDTVASLDPGHSTLESLATIPSLARWTIGQFDDVIGHRVMEAGCGRGNIARHLLDRERLVLVDYDSRHTSYMRTTYDHLENVEIIQGDIQEDDPYVGLDESLDSVLSLNVLEHIEHPELAVERFKRVLAPGGKVAILVPAHQHLFSAADEALGHYRRYSRSSLTQLLEEAGFEVERVFEFNRLGVVGWSINKILGRTTVSRWQVRIFALLLPIARVIEWLPALPGLSVIAIGTKR